DALVVVGRVGGERVEHEQLAAAAELGGRRRELVVTGVGQRAAAPRAGRRADGPRHCPGDVRCDPVDVGHGSRLSAAVVENSSRDGFCRTSCTSSLKLRLAWRRSNITARSGASLVVTIFLISDTTSPALPNSCATWVSSSPEASLAVCRNALRVSRSAVRFSSTSDLSEPVIASRFCTACLVGS